MSEIKKPRGTYDLYGDDFQVFEYISNVLKRETKKFNTFEMMTPIFEHKELFIRSIGEQSDIVTKEFYDFKDKGDRELVLRPENTIGIIRCVVENKLIHKLPLPLRYFYLGPMFRYERPQNGRYRQFNQFGIEWIGIKNIYEQIDLLKLAKRILSQLQINDYQLVINYIGNLSSRQKWIEALKKYFENYKDQLSEDSLNRLSKNPLRILDDKVDGKKEFVINCPKIKEFLSEDEKEEFKQILNALKALNIDYKIDETLVRGLDYYDGLIFEFVSNSKILTGQSTIIGGGKYCSLTKELGDDDMQCIGFGLGIDRIMLLAREFILNQNNSILPNVYIAAIFDNEYQKINIYNLVDKLRDYDIKLEWNFNLNKMDKHFKNAKKNNSEIIIIYGKEEIENNTLKIQNQIQKEEKILKLDDKNLVENLIITINHMNNKNKNLG